MDGMLLKVWAFGEVNEKIKIFSNKIHDQDITNAKGEKFTQAVVIGIGGSYLGCDFAYNAIKHIIDPKINIHFLMLIKN